MTVTVTLPAPPESLPAWQPTMIAMPDTFHGTALRHRVVTIGSGFGGLTATKALKHTQLNVIDVLVFLTRITAQGTSRVVNQTPFWVQFIPATAAAATTMGVLIALCVAVVREHSWRTVRIDNASNAVTTILTCSAKSIAANEIEAADSSRQASLQRSRRTSKGWL